MMTLDVRAPFRPWLGRFPDDPIRDRENGARRVALIVDDRDDETVRRVYANAVSILGDTWNHRRIAARGDNAFLASSAFWASIPEEHVLIYQRDTVLFRPPTDAELAFSMIGAPCGGFSGEGWSLNGGLSLRQTRAMLDVLGFCDRPQGQPEDVFFTQTLRFLGTPLPDLSTAAAFAVESLWSPVPVGVHGTDKPYLSDDVARRLVSGAIAEQEAEHARA